MIWKWLSINLSHTLVLMWFLWWPWISKRRWHLSQGTWQMNFVGRFIQVPNQQLPLRQRPCSCLGGIWRWLLSRTAVGNPPWLGHLCCHQPVSVWDFGDQSPLNVLLISYSHWLHGPLALPKSNLVRQETLVCGSHTPFSGGSWSISHTLYPDTLVAWLVLASLLRTWESAGSIAEVTWCPSVKSWGAKVVYHCLLCPVFFTPSFSVAVLLVF